MTKIRKKTQITNIRSEIGNITKGPKAIKKIVRESYENTLCS